MPADDVRHLVRSLRIAFALLGMTALCGLALGCLSLWQGEAFSAVLRATGQDAATLHRAAAGVGGLMLTVGAFGSGFILAAFVILTVATAMVLLVVTQRVRHPVDGRGAGTAVMPALIEPPSTGRDLLAEMTALGREVRRQVGTVNHEIRTPLAVISGSVQSVRRALPQDADKGRRSAELIAMSCERLVDILDKYRDETSSLVDTFLGTEVLIDVGAFVQDFVVHSGIAHRVTVSHPPHTVRAHTQTANLKEVLNQLLLEVDRGAKSTARISVQSAGAWACIIVSYEGNDVDGTRPEALPGIEFALRSQRARLGLMGAMLHRTIDAGGRMTLLLALPAGA